MDAIFIFIATPIGDWIAERLACKRLRNWIVSLGPYPTLLLFVVPLVVLEPIKPIALYMIGTDHVGMGVSMLVLCEVVR